MFNSSLREFDEDPFVSDPFRAHREHMRQMMRSFSEPFGGALMPSLMDGRNRGHEMIEHPSSSHPLRNEHRENMSADSNTHSFSSSSVMTYSKVGNEPPKVYQATASTRCAPGGIKETRQAIRDSESGLEKMKIGHHIQDRGHVVEKKYNKKTGEKEFNQDFQNMDESEAQSFDDEWQQEVSKFQQTGPMSRLNEPQPRVVHQAALTGPEQAHRDQPRSKAKGKQKK
ncbi:myeloid leukemia factor 1 isoform X3 [Pelmatolapia mariae]|uniref:myeloid leukemia factor 1 isoform X3 n=1 Tax=Pelmatolapia mariae TaxID=158779 RepID=UPI002FE65442